MRIAISHVALGLVLLLTGCTVQIPVDVVFTSADMNPNSRDFLEGPVGDEGTGAGGGDREVVEPDVIRRVDNLLYILNQHRGLSIVDLDTEILLSQTPTTGYPRDLYLRDNRAYVLVSYAANLREENGVIEITPSSLLHVLDIADPAAPRKLGSLPLAGDFIDSRLVGDVLYAISAAFTWHVVSVDEVAKQQSSGTWVTSINVTQPEALVAVDELRFDGFGTVLHATDRALFSAAPDWRNDSTAITYVDIEDPSGQMTLRGATVIPGAVADRFKMDVYQGVLRVVSNTGWANRETYISTLDLSDPDNLLPLGQTTIPSAAGETLFATRFDGPRAYAVTFLMVDPLFVIDLSDPVNPQVTGELKVPGWSTHIEVRGDRLVALGVDDTDGWRVSLSLFDVSDPAAPGLIQRVAFGDRWSWSSAYDDVKAFSVLDDKILVPFSGWNDSGGFDRLQFVSYTPDSLSVEGHIDLDGHVIRAFENEGRFFALTAQEIAIVGDDTQRPVRENTIVLAEYVATFEPLNDRVDIEVIRRFDNGEVRVRSLDHAGDRLGEVVTRLAHLVDVHTHRDHVILVGTGWEDNGYYDVVLIDCTSPQAPEEVARTRVAVTPWYGHWYFYRDIDMPMAEGRPGASAMMVEDRGWWPWFGNQEDLSHVVGNHLVLRCHGERFNTVFGDGSVHQGLAVLDLADLSLEGVVGLGYDQVPRVLPVGDRLYVSSKDQYGADGLGRGVSAYFISAFDPATLRMGNRANVPGQLLDYDPETGVAVLEDWQYRELYQVVRSVATVQWRNGSAARLIDRETLPDTGSMLLSGGSQIYFTAYGREHTLNSIQVGRDGGLLAGGSLPLGNSWAWLLGAKDERVYVVLNNQAVARYDFSGRPGLGAVTEVMNAPASLHIAPVGAYGAMGYGGRLFFP